MSLQLSDPGPLVFVALLDGRVVALSGDGSADERSSTLRKSALASVKWVQRSGRKRERNNGPELRVARNVFMTSAINCWDRKPGDLVVESETPPRNWKQNVVERGD